MRALQTKLEAKGYDIGKVDGILGSGTRVAVQKEQARLGQPADGWRPRRCSTRSEPSTRSNDLQNGSALRAAAIFFSCDDCRVFSPESGNRVARRLAARYLFTLRSRRRGFAMSTPSTTATRPSTLAWLLIALLGLIWGGSFFSPALPSMKSRR